MSLFTPAELAEDRAEFLSLCSDTCRITRDSRPGDVGYVAPEDRDFDEDTLQYTNPPRVIVYEGPCRLQVKADINSNVIEPTAGERKRTYLTLQLQLPVETPTSHSRYVEGETGDVDVDNVCVMLAVPYQPSFEGSELNLAGPFHKSQTVYMRFRVREEAA